MEIEKILFRLSREITESQHDNPLLIGIPRRGDLIAKRISDNLKNFNFSHDLDTVDYIPFRDDINEDIEKTLLKIKASNILKNNGVLILHRHKKEKENFSHEIKIIEEKIYGISKIIFLTF